MTVPASDWVEPTEDDLTDEYIPEEADFFGDIDDDLLEELPDRVSLDNPYGYNEDLDWDALDYEND